MSVFSTARRAGSELVGPGPSTPLSILARDLRVVGTLEGDGVLKIEGRVEGQVRGQAQVLVAPSGIVVGDVSAGEVIVVGRVDGDITATTRIELQPGGVVRGDLAAPRIAVHEGGKVNGRFNIQPVASPTVALRKSA